MLPLHLFNLDHGVVSTEFHHSFNIKFPDILFHVGSISESLSATGITLDDDIIDHLLNDIDVGNRVLYTNDRLFIYTNKDIKNIFLSELSEVDLKIPEVNFNKISIAQIVDTFKIIDFAKVWGLSEEYSPQRVIDMVLKAHSLESKISTSDFLFGRGRGLTPSGDDIMVGNLSILTATKSSQIVDWQKTVKARLQRGGTTDVSESYIQAALEGYTSEKMISFLNIIQKGNAAALRPAIFAIQDFGHTSGTDTLLGMYAAFMGLLETNKIN